MKSLNFKKKPTEEGIELIPEHVTRLTWARVGGTRKHHDKRIAVTLRHPNLMIMRAYGTQMVHTVTVDDVWQMAERRAFNEAMAQSNAKRKEKAKKKKAKFKRLRARQIRRSRK